MLKFLTKIATDILPSVVATVIGAYIVSHYINARPAADTPVAATSAASVVDDPQTANAGANKAAKPDPVYEPGVAAKGISEKAMMEKTAAEGPIEVKPLEAKVNEGRPTETASAPAPDHPHHLAPHERRPVKAATTAAAVVANGPGPAAPAESAEDHRSAVELARAAIERLRGSSEREPQRPAAATSPVLPLPPPITVTMPGSDPSYPHPASARADDPDRPIPPADIPRPPELRVDAGPAPSPRDNAANLADDMLTAAKAMFHVVLPAQPKLSD